MIISVIITMLINDHQHHHYQACGAVHRPHGEGERELKLQLQQLKVIMAMVNFFFIIARKFFMQKTILEAHVISP